MPNPEPETVPVQTDNIIVKRYAGDEGAQVPRCVAEKAYEVYGHFYGASQSFERLHERGGFSICELLMFLYAAAHPKEEWRARMDEANKGMSKLRRY